ncbi:hypothetical protein ABZY81_22640 [Streptomyces sp. NPDC006514]|uniref:hypothetical protein n=1 Tax=Streptomyces sp. NPDC006514 TaxID=3154308 RepID=UPI0033A6622F
MADGAHEQVDGSSGEGVAQAIGAPSRPVRIVLTGRQPHASSRWRSVGGALGYGVRVHAHAACEHPVGTRLTP